MKLIVSASGLAKFLFWLVAIVIVFGFVVGADSAGDGRPAMSDRRVAVQSSLGQGHYTGPSLR
ncbi:hypothetical protein [Amycolatopsis sp. NPDC051071]|uniref:hypothetical protein n=1 Tax=Amycolatopsis sp. NPDC051071 TaxID=3154637 RepID=UPI0034241539